jgi:hypothetical protein
LPQKAIKSGTSAAEAALWAGNPARPPLSSIPFCPFSFKLRGGLVTI